MKNFVEPVGFARNSKKSFPKLMLRKGSRTVRAILLTPYKCEEIHVCGEFLLYFEKEYEKKNYIGIIIAKKKTINGTNRTEIKNRY
ncbi:MAG: hypothetical protein WCJ19_04730 [bacterium]